MITAHQPALIAVLNEHEYVNPTTGAAEGYLADSFGNTFTLQEAAELIMADTGWLVIADKNANVVANFNIRNRVATQNQRMAAVIEQITCGWPGCHNLIKDGQVHHMHAYKHGGRTSQENLTGLCKYHNGRNDDDLDKPRNGHMERDPLTKRVGWKPPGSSVGRDRPPSGDTTASRGAPLGGGESSGRDGPPSGDTAASRGAPPGGGESSDRDRPPSGGKTAGESASRGAPPGGGESTGRDGPLQFNDLPIHNLDGRALINRALNPVPGT